MTKDLTISAIDRQNILNNHGAIEEIQKYLGIVGMLFESEYRFTKHQVAEFYAVDDSTIERYLSLHEDELRGNGYLNMKGKVLREFKSEFGHLLNEGAKAPQLGVFNFRSFLNLGMLLTESEKAKALRSAILDIVIDTINLKLGGSTKYINQRDEDFLFAISREPDYRKEFTTALNKYLDMGNYKYAVYTDAIYKAIFNEKGAEYKRLLKLEDKENPRFTMYAEVLTLISSFEIGIADEIKKKYEILGRKLKPTEVDNIIQEFSQNRFWIPQLEIVRSKMASLDYGLRNVIHEGLESYLQCVTPDDYQRFLGEKSMDFNKRIEENIKIFERLRDR